MAIKIIKKGSLYGGVNNASAENRLSNQVEEMINCMPTVDQGLRLRNSTAPIKVFSPSGIPSAVTFPTINEVAFVYEYDRGTISDRTSELAFIITPLGKLEIVDLTTKNVNGELGGTVYRSGNGIRYANDDARLYLEEILTTSQFSMTTVKDTTFVVNKLIPPKMLPTYDDSFDNPILLTGNVKLRYDTVSGLNPETITGVDGAYVFTPTESTVDVLGVGAGGGGGGGEAGGTFTSSNGEGGYGGSAGTTMNEKAHAVTPLTPYNVTVGKFGLKGLGGFDSPNFDGAAGAAGGDTTFDGIVGVGGVGGLINNPAQRAGTAGVSSDFGVGGIGGVNNGSVGGTGGIGAGGGGGAGGDGSSGTSWDVGAQGGDGGGGELNLEWQYPIAGTAVGYKRRGFVWIKRIDTVTGYSYGCTITILNADGSEDLIIIPQTALIPDDSTLAALALRDAIVAVLGARATVAATGSIVQIELNDTTEEVKEVTSSDSFGDTASFGWAQRVNYQSDLPVNMNGFTSVVQVGEPRQPSYWLISIEGYWQEYHEPLIWTQINPATMPHTITRKFDDVTQEFYFEVEPYTWTTRSIGDDKTNKLPSFMNNPDELAADLTTIKDIFFFRNRLGLVTTSSIIMSEVGEYGSFFRTSVATLLDSDRIDAGVESTNAVNIAYATVLQDSVILFADKAQFRFKGGNILSPASYSIQQEMAYDINIAVEPLFMNDRIFFVARRGTTSALYEMQIANNASQNSRATDITAHVQSYIDGEVDKLSGSPIDNMLFLSTRQVNTIDREGDRVVRQRNTVYVYKYYYNGAELVQGAWGKWTFNGDVVSAFAISRNFYILIDREDALSQSDWVIGSGQWNMAKAWRMGFPWVMSPASFQKLEQFERLQIHPKDTSSVFLDNNTTPIEADIQLGEVIYGNDKQKVIDGQLTMKTIQVRTDDTSALTLYVRDKQRGTYREVLSRVFLPRKPMIYGNAKNVRVGLRNEGIRGFRIDDLSFEVSLTRRTN